MTADRSTKTLLTLLTIIAACLLIQTLLALDRVVEVEARQAPSQPGSISAAVPLRVVIVGWGAPAIARSTPLPVTIQQAQPVPVSLGQPVRLIYSQDNPLPVHVQDRKSLPE